MRKRGRWSETKGKIKGLKLAEKRHAHTKTKHTLSHTHTHARTHAHTHTHTKKRKTKIGYASKHAGEQMDRPI